MMRGFERRVGEVLFEVATASDVGIDEDRAWVSGEAVDAEVFVALLSRGYIKPALGHPGMYSITPAGKKVAGIGQTRRTHSGPRIGRARVSPEGRAPEGR